MNQTSTIHPVIHDVRGRRFEVRIGVGPPAFLSYTIAGDLVILEHTEVPDELRGQGLGAHLARIALTEARQRHWRIVPRCEYVAGFIARHPEFDDLVGPSTQL
jgi:predicted GNAT family acetyltransferase